jgi:hypothetical protein
MDGPCLPALACAICAPRQALESKDREPPVGGDGGGPHWLPSRHPPRSAAGGDPLSGRSTPVSSGKEGSWQGPRRRQRVGLTLAGLGAGDVVGLGRPVCRVDNYLPPRVTPAGLDRRRRLLEVCAFVCVFVEECVCVDKCVWVRA